MVYNTEILFIISLLNKGQIFGGCISGKEIDNLHSFYFYFYCNIYVIISITKHYPFLK